MTHDNTHSYSMNLFGFWSYLMTDCILFSTLFATYWVLQDGTFGGPSAKELWDLPSVLLETVALLASSFSCGLAMLSAPSKNKMTFWFCVTFLLGATFLFLELREFTHFAHEGNSWERSAFLSAFFTLVGTHGFHVTMGLLWMVILLVPLIREGATETSLRRFTYFRMFWHFLDVVWIFIFTLVYLMGVLR